MNVGDVINTRAWSFVVLKECEYLRDCFEVECVYSRDYHTLHGVYIVCEDDF